MIRLKSFIHPQRAGFNDKPPTIRHGILGIDAQIHQDLFDLALVGIHCGKRGGQAHVDLDILPQSPSEQASKGHDHLVEVEGFDFEGLAPPIGHQLAYKIACSFPRLHHQFDVFPGSLIKPGVGQQHFTISQNRGQEVVEVMCHSSGKKPHCLDFLSLAQLPLQAGFFFLGMLSFGDIFNSHQEAFFLPDENIIDADFDPE